MNCLIDSTSEQPPFITFADMMSKVGSFMFYWSSLELQLSTGIKKARCALKQSDKDVCRSFKDRLELWISLTCQFPDNADKINIVKEVSDQTLTLRKIRNHIVHGLQGGNSMPDRGLAYITCSVNGYESPSEETISYTINQLEDFTQGIDACRRAFVNLSHFNYRIQPTRGTQVAT